VVATNASGSSSADGDPFRYVTLVAPVNLVPHQVTGVPRSGQTLTVVPGQWSGQGVVTIRYQWKRRDVGGLPVDIVGQTGTTYVLTSDDVGKLVGVEEIASN
jgi:hypothetical protein